MLPITWGRSFVATAALLCILVHLVNSLEQPPQPESENAGAKPKKQPNFRYELGSLVFEQFSESTQYMDRLRLSKSYSKYVISQKIGDSREERLASRKMTIVEELVRCDNLTLARPEIRPMIACAPLAHQIGAYSEGRISARVAVTNPEGDYTLRYTFKIKNVVFEGVTRRLEGVLYTLDSDSVQTNVDSILAEHKQIDQLGVEEESLGFYVEVNSYRADYTEDISCSGKVITTLNNSALEDYSQRPKPESFLEGLSEILSDVQSGEYLLGINGWTCSSPDFNIFIPVKLNLDFSVIKRKEFPYLSVRHTMNITPMESLWTYSGIIEQYLSQEKAGYETGVRINSSSSAIQWLNFDLVQVFEHGARFTESMLLKASKFIAHVAGSWEPGKGAKILTLFFPNSSEKIPITNDMYTSDRRDMQITFTNLEPKVYKLSMEINRGLVDEYLWGSRSQPEQDGGSIPPSVENRDEL